MSVCRACRDGRHRHDRYTLDGTDAGCPYLAVPGDLSSGCTCPVRLPADPHHQAKGCPRCGYPGPDRRDTVVPLTRPRAIPTDPGSKQ